MTTSALTWITRLLYGLGLLLCIQWQQSIQSLINSTWSYLLTSWIFNSVYFETWWATACYAVLLFFPYVMSHVSMFDSYKLDPRMQWQSAGIRTIVIEAIVYCAPLMLLDTFMVKRYAGVGIDPDEWSTRRSTWIQTTRALPYQPPTVFQIAYQLTLSFLIYDVIFFVLHYSMHRNVSLYRHLHASHHEHTYVHSRVTNQLSVPERIALVLSANQALRLLHAHPLTRAIFVPLFVGWLVENHCGYDLPWALHRVIPGGLIGGAPAHHHHHVHGAKNYQPFFTYIDKYVLQRKKLVE